jgi:hypothetical protein
VRSRSQLDFQNHIGFEAMREPSLMPSFPTQFGPHSARMRTRPTELPQISWLLSPSIPFQAGSQCPIAPPQGAGRTYCTEAASREAVVVDLDVRKDIRLASSSAVKQTAQLRTSEYFVSCKMDFASDHALHQTNAQGWPPRSARVRINNFISHNCLRRQRCCSRQQHFLE